MEKIFFVTMEADFRRKERVVFPVFGVLLAVASLLAMFGVPERSALVPILLAAFVLTLFGTAVQSLGIKGLKQTHFHIKELGKKIANYYVKEELVVPAFRHSYLSIFMGAVLMLTLFNDIESLIAKIATLVSRLSGH